MKLYTKYSASDPKVKVNRFTTHAFLEGGDKINNLVRKIGGFNIGEDKGVKGKKKAFHKNKGDCWWKK